MQKGYSVKLVRLHFILLCKRGCQGKSANSDRGMLLFGYHVQKGPFLVWRVIMVDNLSESTTPRLNSKECHNFLGVTQNNIFN